RAALDQFVKHPIHRIVARINTLTDISLPELTMFAWRAALRDGLRPNGAFTDDLTGLVPRLRALDQDGTTQIIIEEFGAELIELGILPMPEERRMGFQPTSTVEGTNP